MSDQEQFQIYVASRASIPARSEMWKAFRARGNRITSSWIDEAGEGETVDFSDLWLRICLEIGQSDRFVFYAEPGDFPLKGALVEVGIAIANGIPIIACLPGVELEERSARPVGSWIKHSLCERNDDIESVMASLREQQ